MSRLRPSTQPERILDGGFDSDQSLTHEGQREHGTYHRTKYPHSRGQAVSRPRLGASIEEPEQ